MKKIIIPNYVEEIIIDHVYIKLFEFPKFIKRLEIINKDNNINLNIFQSCIPKNIEELKINNFNFHEMPNDYFSECMIKKLECESLFFVSLSSSIKYAICKAVGEINCDMDYLCCMYTNSYNNKNIETFEIIGIIKYIPFVDLHNVKNIIFNGIIYYPKCDYRINKESNVKFIGCHKEFEEFINLKR